MKINSFNNVIPFSSALKSKRNEGDGGAANQQYDPNQTRKDKDSEEEKQRRQPKEVDAVQVNDAVASFHLDAVSQANGLSAVIEGSGPGLKIAVKDINGTILKQFTGEEFLLLRSPDSPNTSRPRGKILDRKI
jgi:hypothetical protein